MLKKLFLILALSAISISASAEDVKPAAPATLAKHGEYKKFDQAEWDKLTKEQKVQRLEENRAIRLKKSDEKWKKMSDDEKIAQYEKRRKKFADMVAKKKAGKPAPAAAPAAQPGEQPKPMPAKS